MAKFQVECPNCGEQYDFRGVEKTIMGDEHYWWCPIDSCGDWSQDPFPLSETKISDFEVVEKDG